jgi:hypothetical protein
MTGLAGLVGDVRPATAFWDHAHDLVGNPMDTAKVIPGPAGGDLAVDHDHEIGHLATSTDLLTWTRQAVIDEPATQPTLAATGDGGLLTAAQCHHGHGGRDTGAILAGTMTWSRRRRRGDFAPWRIYLHDRATGAAERSRPTGPARRSPTRRPPCCATPPAATRSW